MAVSLEPFDWFWCFNFWEKALEVYFYSSMIIDPSDPYNWHNTAVAGSFGQHCYDDSHRQGECSSWIRALTRIVLSQSICVNFIWSSMILSGIWVIFSYFFLVKSIHSSMHSSIHPDRQTDRQTDSRTDSGDMWPTRTCVPYVLPAMVWGHYMHQ